MIFYDYFVLNSENNNDIKNYQLIEQFVIDDFKKCDNIKNINKEKN